MERLTLHSVKLSDTGWYTCVVNNIYGQIQQSAWIAVLMEESFVSPSDSYYLFAAAGVSFIVFVASVIIIATCWQRHRPPKSRPLVLRENSMYFQLNLPIDPQWEINRNQ